MNAFWDNSYAGIKFSLESQQHGILQLQQPRNGVKLDKDWNPKILNGDDEILQITLSKHNDDCTLALVQEIVYESLTTITTTLVISIKDTIDQICQKSIGKVTKMTGNFMYNSNFL